LDSDTQQVAADMRERLGVAGGWAGQESTWTDALMHLRQKIEATGILIVINGVVGNNNYRKLDPDEFRGFVLSDVYAPLVFINGADFKAAQMFTIAHEVAHLWINQEGVSNFEAMQPPPIRVERWCNEVAAEFLVPATELSEIWAQAKRSDEPYQFLAARFKVSSIVAARRALDHGFISKRQFFAFYDSYQKDERRKQAKKSKGGDFWNTQNVRVGQRFGTAVVRAAREGRLLYREAYQLTGLSGSTFDRFAENLGFRT
jgi:Zn-dependent peptidase ImmA (M78 family)